jgi:hypothetical protein
MAGVCCTDRGAAWCDVRATDYALYIYIGVATCKIKEAIVSNMSASPLPLTKPQLKQIKKRLDQDVALALKRRLEDEKHEQEAARKILVQAGKAIAKKLAKETAKKEKDIAKETAAGRKAKVKAFCNEIKGLANAFKKRRNARARKVQKDKERLGNKADKLLQPFDDDLYEKECDELDRIHRIDHRKRLEICELEVDKLENDASDLNFEMMECDQKADDARAALEQGREKLRCARVELSNMRGSPEHSPWGSPEHSPWGSPEQSPCGSRSTSPERSHSRSRSRSPGRSRGRSRSRSHSRSPSRRHSRSPTPITPGPTLPVARKRKRGPLRKLRDSGSPMPDTPTTPISPMPDTPTTQGPKEDVRVGGKQKRKQRLWSSDSDDE